MKKITLFIFFIIEFLFSYSQPSDIIWQQCYGTVNIDEVECIVKSDNSYLLSVTISSDGQNVSNYHGEDDAWIINLDTIGNIIWEKCFGGSESEAIQQIVKTLGNNFYLFGDTESNDGDITCENNHGYNDFWVVKIDNNGNILWNHCYGSPSVDVARDAISTSDGGLLFMGRIYSSGGDVSNYYGSADVWICKIDSSGMIEWEKTVGNIERDNGIKLKMISDSSFAFTGGYYESGGMINCQVEETGYGTDLWLVEMKLSNGEILNQYCYGGSYNDLGYDFEKVENGYIIVAVTSSNDGDVSGLHGPPGEPMYYDIWVVRIDEQGYIIWQKCLGGYYSETPRYVTQTEDLGFIIIGSIN